LRFQVSALLMNARSANVLDWIIGPGFVLPGESGAIDGEQPLQRRHGFGNSRLQQPARRQRLDVAWIGDDERLRGLWGVIQRG
jgi:hypothetical protein